MHTSACLSRHLGNVERVRNGTGTGKKRREQPDKLSALVYLLDIKKEKSQLLLVWA